MQCQAILVLYSHFVASQIVQITFEFLTGLCRCSLSFFFFLRAKRARQENDHRYSRLSRARALPSLNLKKKGDCPIKTTVTNALVLILTGKYEMNNKPRAFRVKITRTCNSPSQKHGTWCHKSLRSVPSDPEEVVYYHFAEERTHKQCTCQKFCREVVPRFFFA